MLAKHFPPLLIVNLTLWLAACGGDVATNTKPEAFDVDKPVESWTLVWSDEFDGNSIDSAKWNHEVNCAGGGNNERQCYTDSSDNSFVADGLLNIVALPAAEGAEKPYTSARLTTQNKGDFKYGRFEVRAKLPSGQGAWPAFWMLPTDSVYGGWPQSGEIDILEAVNLKVTDTEGNPEAQVLGTLHYGRPWPDNSYTGKAYTLPQSQNPADDFHTYAVEWQEGEIRWYVDDYLYATQRKSELRLNSKDQAVGLSHRGWFSEYFDQGTGELQTHWDNSPYNQEFFMILNFAVGGDWPENVNQGGVDASAFTDGPAFQIDYVRVYQCSLNPDTGKGCETVRPNYDSLDDALVEGQAPTPSLPGKAQDVAVFEGEINPNWPAVDCCGGSTPELVADEERGNVLQFSVGETPTVNGFISRSDTITDAAGSPSPFDASSVIDSGSIRFDLKIITAPSNTDSEWLFKMEGSEGAVQIELPLSESAEGQAPAVGQWQSYTFSLAQLAEGGNDLSAIDAILVFPAWGTGDGALYQLDKVHIDTGLSSSAELVVFATEENPNWPLWDCCGGSTPAVVGDDDEHGAVAEFVIGAEPTVMGFYGRGDDTLEPAPFDATSMISQGVVQFDLKVTTLPNNSQAPWIFKIEGGSEYAAELPLTDSLEGLAPVQDQWQTYTFNLSALEAAGLDLSGIDVIMVFPAWGEGEGAVYRIDNLKIYDPTANNPELQVLFADDVNANWSLQDCCGGTTPSLENDDSEHGATAEFTIGAEPTVVGLWANEGSALDASALFDSGVVQFEMKVLSPPNDSSSEWKFKIESNGATQAVELNLSDSQEGLVPAVDTWQTYTYSLQDLFAAGLDISAIDVLMVFPAWGTGDGAVFRLDNVQFFVP